jgi:hypothetical protein
MEEDRNDTGPEEGDPKQQGTPSNDDDEMFLFVLANALVPIFFRRRR